MRRVVQSIAVVAAAVGCGGPDVATIRARDLVEVTAALESNLAAIRRRDAEGYLAHYVDSPELVIASSDSLRRGFLFFAEARRADPTWPDALETGPPVMVWLSPGVVWAGFEFTAVIGSDTTWGVSERVFVKTPSGWKISITGSMEQ